ncbi:MAG: hypothetical protein JXM73_25375 [Anaerolineae bacterium]|nr:hypothetical protein [Anaerolineae bacterium]
MKNRDQAYCQAVTGRVADYLWQELQLHPKRGDYRLIGMTSGPRVLTLSLRVNPAHVPGIVRLAEQLSMAVGLDSHESVRVGRGTHGTLTVEIPKPREFQYTVPVRALPSRHGLKAPIGLDVEHRPALINFADPLTPHLLTAGTTGSGKTNTSRLLVLNLARQNTPEELHLILIDTRKKGIAWLPFGGLAHLAHPVITDEVTALRLLLWAVAEIDRRAQDRRCLPRVFIAVEEAQSLLERPEFVKSIGDIAAVGREFGLHLILSTQNPTAEMLGSTSIKRNLTARLVGKTDTADAAKVAAGVRGSGAELLTGAGDQILVQPRGVQRVATALVTEADVLDLPRVGSDHVYGLDLAEYDDADHVVEQAGNTSKAAPLEPEHVAYALISQEGINKLARELGIGSTRAGRVRDFAAQVLSRIEALGYTIIPLAQETALSRVTQPVEIEVG